MQKREPAREAGFFVFRERVLMGADKVRGRRREPSAAVAGGIEKRAEVSSSSFMGRALWERWGGAG